MKIPLSEPDISEAEVEEVVSVLRSSRLSLGPKMEEFEASLCSYVDQPFGIAVSSGTTGLHLCIRALGIGPGDEVIVPSFTFIAAANAVLYEGATPVFVDIDPLSLNLDPDRVEKAISERTRAILVVHTFGIPAEMDAILELAERYCLKVIEDACEAIGATYHGRQVGSFGDAAVFAFYPNKQITTGEGGMVVTGDRNFAMQIRAMRNQGRYESDEWHQHSILGWNYRLSEINCALGCAQMRRIDDILSSRAAVARAYDEALSNVDGVERPPLQLAGREISWFVYVVRLAPRFSREDRDAVARMLIARGIGCGRYFAPIHSQPAYSHLPSVSLLTVTESVSSRTLALPFFNRLDKGRILQVAEALDEAVRSLER
ncbi:DegT/DnrJ/EryC1/StrS aminotransferase family protein [Granulicella sp. S190]|uniref:DegT/DnrJ/EryC1/StrS family aminotransferase n=1 Tax=Granulicella sp. S190 TaxID=1747226 RepID=UPI00131A6847|nr:DegT/DnrJ/EryC1/StrS family aminotransferase [Granulicella sp. S190]